MPYYQAGDYYQGDNYAAGGFPLIGAALALGKKLLLPAAKKVIGKAVTLFRQPGAVAATAISARTLIPTYKKPQVVDGMGYPMGAGFARRRMNVTNVKALRRAGRRVKGFLKLARGLGALPVSSGKQLFKPPKRKKCT